LALHEKNLLRELNLKSFAQAEPSYRHHCDGLRTGSIADANDEALKRAGGKSSRICKKWSRALRGGVMHRPTTTSS